MINSLCAFAVITEAPRVIIGGLDRIAGNVGNAIVVSLPIICEGLMMMEPLPTATVVGAEPGDGRTVCALKIMLFDKTVTCTFPTFNVVGGGSEICCETRSTGTVVRRSLGSIG